MQGGNAGKLFHNYYMFSFQKQYITKKYRCQGGGYRFFIKKKRQTPFYNKEIFVVIFTKRPYFNISLILLRRGNEIFFRKNRRIGKARIRLFLLFLIFSVFFGCFFLRRIISPLFLFRLNADGRYHRTRNRYFFFIFGFFIFRRRFFRGGAFFPRGLFSDGFCRRFYGFFADRSFSRLRFCSGLF